MNLIKRVWKASNTQSNADLSAQSAAKDKINLDQLKKVTFASLGLDKSICNAVEGEGYTEPTPIQQAAIPHILEGRDLVGCAQTGTGKTAAFTLPMVQCLARRKLSDRSPRGHQKIHALVLTPTRELAIQIGESVQTYSRGSALSYTTIYGGVSQERQVRALVRSPDVLIATPGRLLDLQRQGHLDLSCVSFLVLDEADRMLDMGFLNDVKKILALVPSERQNLLFSATMPDDIRNLAKRFLNQPVHVEVAPISSTAECIEQTAYYVNRANKRHLLVHVVNQHNIRRGLVFARTKAGANRITEHLIKNGIEAAAIHSNKSQSARQRALNDFKEGRIRLLVASDIVSRGIDVEEVTHVVNFDTPNIAETYVHRIGRTGRAMATGHAMSFVDSGEYRFFAEIERLIQRQITIVKDHPYTADADREEEPIMNGRNSRVQRNFRQRPSHGDRSGSKNRDRRR